MQTPEMEVLTQKLRNLSYETKTTYDAIVLTPKVRITNYETIVVE